MRTGYVWDEKYLGHFTSTVHPEKPERADVLRWSNIQPHLPNLVRIPVVAHPSDYWITSVHTRAYVDTVKEAFKNNRWRLDGGDTLVKADTFDVAAHAVFGALSLVYAVCNGEVQNGFAAIRPPGHHAGDEYARGFCYFNNVAICARYAQKFFNYSNILIIDWDVHPADGTMDIFYEDPSVFVFSIHQHGIFTDTIGTVEQTGSGAGKGTTVNIPMPKGSSESDYLNAFTPALSRAAALCKPDLVLISCGFDIHRSDPLGGMKLDDESFKKLTKVAKSIADEYCDGRLVSLLEGGYSIQALPRCVHCHLEELMA